MQNDTQDRPSTPRKEYTDAAPDISLIRDLMGGTRRMHGEYKKYIAKYKAEKPEAYKRRATSAKVYGGLSRTISAAVGMLFSKPPEKVDRWNADLDAHWENIDGKGTHGDVFTKRRSEDAIADGFSGILVDHPSAPDDVIVHSGNEADFNLRPMWAPYTRSDIISWRTKPIGNVETLTQLVLREGATEDSGKYAVEHAVLYRVCKLSFAKDPERPEADPQLIASWELIEEKTDQTGRVTLIPRGSGVFRDRSGVAFDVIPFAVVYAGRTDSTLTAHPPLLDVAWANLEHWRVATNLRFYEDLCCFPQPYVKGDLKKGPNGEDLPFTSGPGVLVQTDKEGEFSFAELQGTSLDQLRQSLQEKKDEISELGMSFLSKRSRAVETAEAKRLDATAENSTLATSAQGIEDGHNLALQFHAKYLGVGKEQAPTIKINRDFENMKMTAEDMGAYSGLVGLGFPKEAVVKELIAGGRLAPDTDVAGFVAQWEATSDAAKDLADMEARANGFPPRPGA